MDIFDTVLREPSRIDEALADPSALPSLIQRLLTLAVVGTGAYGVVVGAVAVVLNHRPPIEALAIALAMVLAFMLTLCVCLPSFYFYTQLSGLDASFLVVTAQALRVQATTAVLLLGVLPFYAAVAFACGLGWLDDPGIMLGIGFWLPFVVGLFGIRALYRSFVALAKWLPRTHERRGRFLLRMVSCWGAVYASVAPIALARILSAFGVV